MWGRVTLAPPSHPILTCECGRTAFPLQLTHASSGTPTQAPPCTGGEGTDSWAKAASRALWADPPPSPLPGGLLQVLPRRLCWPFSHLPQPGHVLPECHRLFTISVHPHPAWLPATRQPAAVPLFPTGLALLAARPPQPSPLTGNHTVSDPNR